MKKNQKIIFMGTPDFASYVLETLISNQYNIIAIVSQPNRRVGRKKIEQLTPVAQTALKHGIVCIQPEKINDCVDQIKSLDPDLILTCAYGQFVSQEILNIPKLGCLNLHASILPKYRGGAPIQYALLNGDKETGISLMEMISKMDAGRVFDVKKTSIDLCDNQATVYEKLKECANDVITDSLQKYLKKELVGIEQDEKLVSFAPNITREQERINIDKSGYEIYNQVRALNPVPGAYFVYKDLKVKIFSCDICKNTYDGQPYINRVEKDTLILRFTGHDLLVRSLQLEGKRKMTFKELYVGHSNFFEPDTYLM